MHLVQGHDHVLQGGLSVWECLLLSYWKHSKEGVVKWLSVCANMSWFYYFFKNSEFAGDATPKAPSLSPIH